MAPHFSRCRPASRFLNKPLILLLWSLGSSVILLSCSSPSREQSEDKRPNILLIVADDLGYADLGCYGGDIETPHIDGLAAGGVRFSRFHTSPYCAPTRAMLLSGNDNHIAGMGSQGVQSDRFGYEGRLTDRVATIPELLRDAGYHTYMAGKWHLGDTLGSTPHERGFEHSFVLTAGGHNHYVDQRLFEDYPISPFTEDGQPATWKDGDYSTDFYTDKLIQYIERHREDNKPFFAYAAYTSPHWPLQVDEVFWEKYMGRYDDGYEKLKERRLESLKQAGMIPSDAVLPPDHERVKPWDSLTDEEKRKESRKMELYAGMVDNLDHNIGRILQYLKETGELENTFILFMSDNGAAAEDFFYDEDTGPFLRTYFNDDYENMGKPDSYISYGPQWAEAGSSPFRYFKGYPTEGGINAPMLITGPGVQKGNEIHHGWITLMDIAPTFYELARTSYPDTYNDKEVYPLPGSSLMPFLSGKTTQVHSEDDVFGLEHGNLGMIRKGDWKITNIRRPFHADSFQLFDLSKDLAEINDLKNQHPDKHMELLGEWDKFSDHIKISFPARDDAE